MKTFSSLGAVFALWLAVSFSLWLAYRLFKRHDHKRQRRLVETALLLIEEGQAIFSAIRKIPAKGRAFEVAFQVALEGSEDALHENVRALLNAIEANSGYFDRVNGTKKRIQQEFSIKDFMPLSEILQIRRDFWAASEVLLMEDIQSLGIELESQPSYNAFRLEAVELLFKSAPSVDGSEDAVSLRFAVAQAEAKAFLATLEEAIARDKDKNKLPRLKDIVHVPWHIVKAFVSGMQEIRYIVADFSATAQSLARTMTSRGLGAAAQELRKVRSDLPSQFAAAFEKAGGTAQQGGHHLKRHYEFLLEARELRARYAEVLARTPHLTEKAKQFITRLELEKRADQFRETSESALSWGRRKLVVLIAYIIAGLQIIQAKVTPKQNKQLAVTTQTSNFSLNSKEAQSPSSAHPPMDVDPKPSMRRPLRVLLPPANPPTPAPPSPKETFARLGDSVRATLQQGKILPQEQRPSSLKAGTKQSKPRYSYENGMQKTTFKELLSDADPDGEFTAKNVAQPSGLHKTEKLQTGKKSLVDRLSGLNSAENASGGETANEDANTTPKTPQKKLRFKIF